MRTPERRHPCGRILFMLLTNLVSTVGPRAQGAGPPRRPRAPHRRGRHRDSKEAQHDQEEHQAPSTLWVIMLKDARNASLPVHTGVGHHTVLSLLRPRGQLSSSDVCHNVTS